jgi:hypothetical protein
MGFLFRDIALIVPLDVMGESNSRRRVRDKVSKIEQRNSASQRTLTTLPHYVEALSGFKE